MMNILQNEYLTEEKKVNEMKEVEREKGIKNEKNNLDYDFVTYIRK